MSSTIDYQIGIVKCSSCKSEIQIHISVEQDNRTCEVHTSWPNKVDCPYCDKKDIRVTKRNLRR